MKIAKLVLCEKCNYTGWRVDSLMDDIHGYGTCIKCRHRQSLKEKESLKDVLEYDPSSPSGLRWKITILGGKHRSVIMTYPGKVAGTKAYRPNHNPMWWQVKALGKTWRAHRIVWELCKGKPPTSYIDHIDGNPFNNNIDNLREVTPGENSRNVKKTSRNKTGKVGVSFEEINNIGYYIAHIAKNGKVQRKRFSVKKLGVEKAFILACQWRDSNIEEMNREGYGYTERHGK